MYNNATNTNMVVRTNLRHETVFRNIVLDGVNSLKAEKAFITFEETREHNLDKNKSRIVSKKQIGEDVEHVSFNLVETTPEKLKIYRKKRIPSFVLKVDGKLYHTAIPKKMGLLGTNLLCGEHMCGKACNRMSPACDEDGGCEKVRNYATYIEKYDWISLGYETFGTRQDSLAVIKCSHYQKMPPRKDLTPEARNRKKLALAKFVWDDVETLAEVRERKNRNRNGRASH